jgi:hypothetical protein
MADTNGTKVVSKIVPTDTLDEYATHDADYGRGGYVSVADIAARDAITAQRRKQGMMVYVNSTNTKYVLKDGVTNSDWVEDTSGGGSVAVDSVNGATGVVVLDADDIDDTSTTNKFTSAADKSKLDGIESGATADQSSAEIKAAYESNADTNAFQDIHVAKLSGIESGAEVNPTNAEIKTAYELNANTNAFTDAEKTKLGNLSETINAVDVVFDDTLAGIGATDLQDVAESLDARLDSLEGGGGFTDPSSISGCFLWFDGADDSSFTENGSNEILTFSNKGDPLVAGTVVNAPTRTVTYNGNKAVTFNGDNTPANADYIKFGTKIADALSGATGYSAFYVYNSKKDKQDPPDNLSGYDAVQVILDSWGGTEFTRLRHYIHDAYAPYEFVRDHGDNGGSRIVGEYGMPENELKIVDSRGSVPNKSLDMLINGAEENWTTDDMFFTKTEFETANGSTGTGNSEDTIGAEHYDGVSVASYPHGISAFRGDICEIIVYNRRLTATQMTQVRNYLSNKWGITVAGGDLSDGLNDLSDVSVVDNVDGHVLKYNAATAQYENGFPEDVVTTWTASKEYAVDDLVEHDDYIYRCNTAHTSAVAFSTHASNWTEMNVTQGAIKNWVTGTAYVINDVVLSPDDEIYMCTANHTASALFATDSANWKSIATSGGGSGSGSLSGLSDVFIPTPTDGQVLTYSNATSKWNAVTPDTYIDTISGLTDTTISSPSDGQALTWDSSTLKWVNTTLAGGGSVALNDITDVNAGSPSDGQVLTWDSTTSKWVAETPSGGSGGASALNDLSDVSISTLTNRDVLVYNSLTGDFENIGSLTETPSFDLPYLKVEGSDGSSITSSTNVDFATVVEDTDSGWNAAGNYYVIPTTGRYLVNASVWLTSYKSWSGLEVFLDSGSGYVGQGSMARNYSTDVALENFVIDATAGDKLAIRWDTSGTLSTGAQYHHLTIQGLAVTQNIALTPELTGKYQTKSLSSEITATSSNVTALGFNNLVVGKMYQVSGHMTCITTSNDDNTKTVLAGYSIGGGVSKLSKYNYTHTGATFTIEYSYIFEATQSSIVFSVNTLSNVKLTNTGAGTSMTLIEHPSSMDVTTDFT